MADAVHDALEESVRNQMISERPLGVFLSGGVGQKELNRVIHLHNNGLDKDQILWPLFVIELWAQKWLD